MSYLISQILDIDKLKIFMNSIYKITQIPMSIANTDGTILFSCQNTNLCSELCSVNSDINLNCLQYYKKDLKIYEKRKYFICKCDNGRASLISPIVINGCYLANLFTGQFVIEKKDLPFFEDYKNYFFDLQNSIKIIKDISIISKYKLKSTIDLHLQLMEVINSFSSDCIKKVNAEKKLEISEVRYKLAILGSNDAIWDWNMENGEFFISERWKEITGYSIPAEYNFFMHLKDIIHKDDIKKFDFELRKHICGETSFFQCEYRIKIHNGNYKWILQRGKILHNKKGQHIRMAGSITDITNRKIYEEDIRYQAYYDYLTNLPNRLFLNKKLNEKINTAADSKDYKFAVFIIDIYDFKIINNTFGQEIGDRILALVAEKLKAYKIEKEILFRLSADEFLLLHMDYKDIKEVEQRVKEVISIFDDNLEMDCRKIKIEVNIGVTLFPNDGNDADKLLSNTYVALNDSKKLGKNRYSFFSKKMSDELINKMNIEAELAKAIDNDEFILYYQPQININKMTLYGLEALIRWKHPKLGIVSPAYFIDIAEQNGMINSIGKFVIYEACKELKKLHNEGFNNLVMSVNVSVKQLKDKTFYDYFEKIIKETKVNTKFINIEITEGTLLNSSSIELNTLELLRNNGIKIFIDDFGTKYSSLNYIYRLPVDGIKIDKSFIDEIKKSKKEFIILRDIIGLANEINIDVIAEGVEYPEQLESLRNINCKKVQGYIFDKPIAPESIVNCLSKYRN